MYRKWAIPWALVNLKTLNRRRWRKTSEVNWAIDWAPGCITVLIRLNAALEQTPQIDAKLPINGAPNQKNAPFTRG